MVLEFRRDGHKVTQRQFFDGFLDHAIEEVMTSFAEELHGKAASVVDPNTGKHAPVFVRRIGIEGWSIHTSGSPAFARALEKRLGLDIEEVCSMTEPGKQERIVYLAHASEDKHIAKPLAEGLMQSGIDVWYDNWEIRYGDSLRRKMEEGLGDCTHFVVLLTETSITKPWVNEEIDVGLLRAIEGSAKFIGLRYELPLSSLSPFLSTRLSPEFKLNEDGLEELVGEIFGISKKPPLGDRPRYVQTHKQGSTWSASARAVAEYFVRNSINAGPLDPQANYADIQEKTGLPMPDVRIGVLDLIGAGLLEKQDYSGGSDIWPKEDLFVIFDEEFMNWNPEDDARSLAVHLLNLESSVAEAAEAGKVLGWEPRRLNSAAAYLVSARIVKPVKYSDESSYWPPAFQLGDELLRFVRSL